MAANNHIMISSEELKEKLLSMSLDDVIDNEEVLELDIEPFLRKNYKRDEPEPIERYPNTYADNRCLECERAGIYGSANSSRFHFDPECGRVFVDNLRYELNDTDIHMIFGTFGPLVRAAINYLSDGRAAGTAFVVFMHKRDAIKCVDQIDGQSLDGRPLRLTLMDDISYESRGAVRYGAGRFAHCDLNSMTTEEVLDIDLDSLAKSLGQQSRSRRYKKRRYIQDDYE